MSSREAFLEFFHLTAASRGITRPMPSRIHPRPHLRTLRSCSRPCPCPQHLFLIILAILVFVYHVLIYFLFETVLVEFVAIIQQVEFDLPRVPPTCLAIAS